MSEDRSAQLAAALAAVRARVDAACRDAGRPTDDVTLIVVTKTFPVDDVARLSELGVRDVGENRHQEASEKAQALAGRGLRWHFVGQLQRNKARAVAGYADVVHSLDRAELVRPLAAGAQDAGRRVGVLVQVDLDESGAAAGRGGAAPDDVRALAEQVEAADGLDLRGVMAVAPRDADPARAFARLREVSDGLRADHPAASWISAGMSGDLEQAVAAGATHLRVGSAVLGQRPPLQ
jgi:pyridoxal phosphate enzyme (YggS family)